MRKALGMTIVMLLIFTATLTSALKPVEAQEAETLHVITAHWSGIYNKIGAAFQEYMRTEYGATVDIIFESHGTGDIKRLVEAAAGSPAWSVWWGGGLDAFIDVEAQGLLTPFYDPGDPKWERIDRAIPDELFGLQQKDLDEKYGTYNFWGSALSGFGVMVNTEYLRRSGLPYPKKWEDLTNPVYRGHVTMCAPIRSGSTHMIIEIILQSYGWIEGWRILEGIGSNVGFFAERSYHVPGLVNTAEYGVGLVIDFYGFGGIAAGYPVEFFYPPKDEVKKATIINPDSIALLKGAPEPELGKRFMEFVLGYEGQKLLFEDPINRLPVRHDVYTEAPEGYFDPFVTEMALMTYDDAKGSLRYDLIDVLYDVLVTERQENLRAAMGALYDAESALLEAEGKIADIEGMGFDVSKAKKTYQEAVSLYEDAKALMIPLTESEALDIADEFSLEENPSFVEKKKAEWTTHVVDAYKSVLQTAPEIKAKALESVEDARASASTTLEERETAIKELSGALEGAQTTIKDLRSALESAEATTEELKSALTSGIDSLTTQLEDLTKAVSSQVEELRKTVSPLQASISGLEATSKSLESDIKQQRSSIAIMNLTVYISIAISIVSIIIAIYAVSTARRRREE
ncbi:MAG: extracellular solute-binding protein [Candidatus Geothermarchaeales archaeon]